jgi:hypothetical protein
MKYGAGWSGSVSDCIDLASSSAIARIVGDSCAPVVVNAATPKHSADPQTTPR